jgi:hypothetical protein
MYCLQVPKKMTGVTKRAISLREMFFAVLRWCQWLRPRIHAGLTWIK